jgi:anti-sigma factor ChrR (cupin superfamily)
MTRSFDRMMAAEYALGALNDADRDAARVRMAQDPAFAADVFYAQSLIADAEQQSEIIPAPALLDAIDARIDAIARQPSAVTVRHDEGRWLPVLAGVRVKMLHRDLHAGRQRYLVQMDPGARLPAHAHRAVEECVMLGGELRIDGMTITTGDFHLVPAGVDHPELHSPRGALFYISGELDLAF